MADDISRVENLFNYTASEINDIFNKYTTSENLSANWYTKDQTNGISRNS